MPYVPASIASLNPPYGISDGGTTVVLTGQNFTGITGVQFGSLAASSFTINSNTQITAVSPAQNCGNVSVGVLEYNGNVCGAATFTYTSGIPISTTLTQVSCGSRTNVWGVDASHNIWQYTGSGTNWTQISGKLKQVSVGADGTVWGADPNGLIYQYAGNNTWTQIPGNLAQVSVGSASLVWGVNSAGTVYQYAGNNTWTQLPGANLKQVSVASDGTVWGVNSGGIVYQYAGNNAWTQIPGNVVAGGPNVPFTEVIVASAYQGQVWSLDGQGNSYEYVGGSTPWTTTGLPLARSFSCAADGSFVVIDLQGITELLVPPDRA